YRRHRVGGVDRRPAQGPTAHLPRRRNDFCRGAIALDGDQGVRPRRDGGSERRLRRRLARGTVSFDQDRAPMASAVVLRASGRRPHGAGAAELSLAQVRGATRPRGVPSQDGAIRRRWLVTFALTSTDLLVWSLVPGRSSARIKYCSASSSKV